MCRRKLGERVNLTAVHQWRIAFGLGFRVGSGWGRAKTISVNGQSSVQHFSAGTDQSFEQQLIVKGVPTSQCHLAVAAVTQRDPAQPDAAATLRPGSVDAEIQVSG
jgi:hypothetical protein